MPEIALAKIREDAPFDKVCYAVALTCRRIVDWYIEGKINIDDLITHVLPLERINEGFELMRGSRRCAA